jgi:hypothetical protein
MRFSSIEGHDHSLLLWMNFYLANAAYLHERPTQLSHAFIAILAFRSNLDRFQNRPVTLLGEKGAAWIGIAWSGWIHTIYLTRPGKAAVVNVAGTSVSRWSPPRGASHLGLSSNFSRDRFKSAPDVFRQNSLTGDVRMKPIGQIQQWVTRHTLQKIRHQRSMIPFRKVNVHSTEGSHVVVGRVIRQLHAGNNDSHVWVALLYLVDDRLKILSNLFNRHSAEGIVYSQLENEDIDSTFEVRRKPEQPAFRGPPAGAGVSEFEIQTGRAQFFNQPGRIRLGLLELKSFR